MAEQETPLTPEWIAKELEICEAATPGPWYFERSGPYGWDDGIYKKPNPTFGDEIFSNSGHSGGSLEAKNGVAIVAARTGYPAALRQLQVAEERAARAEAEVARLRVALTNLSLSDEKLARELEASQ